MFTKSHVATEQHHLGNNDLENSAFGMKAFNDKLYVAEHWCAGLQVLKRL